MTTGPLALLAALATSRASRLPLAPPPVWAMLLAAAAGLAFGRWLWLNA